MTSFYRAGWRPAAGWACVAGLVVGLVAVPLANVMLAATGAQPVPSPGIGELLAATLGAAGMGALRSHDKLKGLE